MTISEMSLQEIKETAFNILKTFKVFCEENGINYYLSNGTLLGAVKYQGFIPWDDDIDVFVPREDYNKLIAVYKDTQKYKLYSSERVVEYKFPFAKLCDMSTRKVEANIDNGVNLGIEIDIFPLDNCTKHILEPRVMKKLKRCQIACILSKMESVKGKTIYKRLIINYCKYRGYRYYADRMLDIVNKESALGSTHKGCMVWPIYGEREVVSADVFSSVVEVEFEGEKFPAPIGYENYLSSLYGNYRKDPPIEKQKTHHFFKAYRID